MYSLNAPVPTDVARLARGLAAETRGATPRDRHTLVVKRLVDDDPSTLARAVRERVEGLGPFEVRVDGVEVFAAPPAGSGPVAYLAVESPALVRVHRALCERFDPLEGLEGDAYVPHVTIARGGDADRLADRDADTRWSVTSLVVWSADYGEPVERISLPA